MRNGLRASGRANGQPSERAEGNKTRTVGTDAARGAQYGYLFRLQWRIARQSRPVRASEHSVEQLSRGSIKRDPPEHLIESINYYCRRKKQVKRKNCRGNKNARITRVKMCLALSNHPRLIFATLKASLSRRSGLSSLRCLLRIDLFCFSPLPSLIAAFLLPP